MTTTPIDGFLLSMAANLATDLLKTGAQHLASAAFGDAETRALQRAYCHAFAKMLTEVGTHLDKPMLEHVRELLQLFVRDSQSNQMLLDVALVGADLPLVELRQRFWALGYDASTLKQFKFDNAMISLILGLAEGLQREAGNASSPLYNRVSLGRLKTLETLLNENQHDLHAATQSLQQLEQSLRQLPTAQSNAQTLHEEYLRRWFTQPWARMSLADLTGEDKDVALLDVYVPLKIDFSLRLFVRERKIVLVCQHPA